MTFVSRAFHGRGVSHTDAASATWLERLLETDRPRHAGSGRFCS